MEYFLSIFLIFHFPSIENGETDEAPVIIRNSATGEILRGDAAPDPDEVEEWLAKNPGYELISRDTASDSDDDGDEEMDTSTIAAEKKEDEFEGFIFYRLRFGPSLIFFWSNDISYQLEMKMNSKICDKNG